MKRRKIASILMLLVFLVLCITGLLSYLTEYTRAIATVHTIFGFVFTMVALVHILNNIKPLSLYLKSGLSIVMITGVGLLGYTSWNESGNVQAIMDYGARSKAKIGVQSDEASGYEVIEMDLSKEGQLTLELKRNEHFWHPQVAVWTEDITGSYIETLYVTKATAKGIFAGGRTKDNFKSLDTETVEAEEGYRRVNALPVWSYKRGYQYEDGLYAPTYENPLPDAMSGATPLDHFTLKSSVDYETPFVVKLEINVAFDDNEYYSEFDFPEDDVFHNGTGQLGQPSIVFQGVIDPMSNESYALMELLGHGHHSALDGQINDDLSKLTTALEIVEYIVLGYDKSNT